MAVSIVEFLKMNSSIMARLEIEKKIHMKWEIEGGKKIIEGMTVSIVDSSIMANKFYLKWESALVKWELVGGKKEVEGMAVSIVEFLKMYSLLWQNLIWQKNFMGYGKVHL